MKKAIILAVATASLISSGCTNDDGPKPGKIYPEKTYTSENGLSITIGGEPILGKCVTFTPDSKNARKAVLKLGGYFDLASIPDFPASLAQTVKTGGIIPGDVTTDLPITLIADGTDASFSGTAESDYCTYSYSGTVSDNALVLSIEDVKLKNTAMCGIWTPLKYQADNTTGELVSSPVYTIWESDASFNIGGTKISPDEILKMLIAMPLIKKEISGQAVNLSISQAVEASLRKLEFRDVGNVIASLADETVPGSVVQTPANMATYAVTGTNDFTFYLNPDAVLAMQDRTSGGSRSVDGVGSRSDDLLSNLMLQVGAMMQGMPMHYDISGNNLNVYIGTEVLRHLLKTDVLPLLKDELVVAKLIELVNRDANLAPIAAQLPDLLDSAALVIEKTTRLEIGLSLQR